jgi:GNAT superfamily N-acetyltransferase
MITGMASETIDVRAVRSEEELRDAMAFVSRIFPRRPDTWRDDGFFLRRFPEEADLMVVAIAAHRIVGAALAHRNGPSGAIVAAVAIDAAARRQGLGRRLLECVEHNARRLGIDGLALGSVDESAEFYVRCGWTPRLLLQFDGPAAACSRDRARERFADYPLADGQWRDVLQLFVQTGTVDFALYERVADLPGANASYMMTKRLAQVPDT